MSRPTVLLNTFITENINKIHIDKVSKCFIVLKAGFGFNRTSILWPNNRLWWFNSIYSVIFASLIILTAVFFYCDKSQLIIYTIVVQYLCGFLCCYWKCDRLKLFYDELNKFDFEVGCRPGVDRYFIYNVLQIIFTCIIFLIALVLPFIFGFGSLFTLRVLPFALVYTLELGYYAHLLCLFIPRLKLINCYIEYLMYKKLDRKKIPKSYSLRKKNMNLNCQKINMRKITEFYVIIVEAYDHFMFAVKWPLLAVIILSFLTLLVMYIFMLLKTIHGPKFYFILAVNLGSGTALMLPLFGPCVVGDYLHGKVVKLRELLAAYLYQNKLDKSDRGVARALLEYTEIRDLSFCLLRVLKIDISLPFKFIGLLVTYIIIILQFDKVVNPTEVCYDI